MKTALFDQMKKNSIIDQLKQLNITDINGQALQEASYTDLKYTLTMAKLTMDQDVQIEAEDNKWY